MKFLFFVYFFLSCTTPNKRVSLEKCISLINNYKKEIIMPSTSKDVYEYTCNYALIKDNENFQQYLEVIKDIKKEATDSFSAYLCEYTLIKVYIDSADQNNPINLMSRQEALVNTLTNLQVLMKIMKINIGFTDNGKNKVGLLSGLYIPEKHKVINFYNYMVKNLGVPTQLWFDDTEKEVDMSKCSDTNEEASSKKPCIKEKKMGRGGVDNELSFLESTSAHGSNRKGRYVVIQKATPHTAINQNVADYANSREESLGNEQTNCNYKKSFLPRKNVLNLIDASSAKEQANCYDKEVFKFKDNLNSIPRSETTGFEHCNNELSIHPLLNSSKIHNIPIPNPEYCAFEAFKEDSKETQNSKLDLRTQNDCKNSELRTETSYRKTKSFNPSTADTSLEADRENSLRCNSTSNDKKRRDLENKTCKPSLSDSPLRTEVKQSAFHFVFEVLGYQFGFVIDKQNGQCSVTVIIGRFTKTLNLYFFN